MPLTVRLDPKSQRALDQLARRRRQTRSQVVREAIEHLTATEAAPPGVGTALGVWSDVVGIVDLGRGGTSATTGVQYAEIVQKKARTRRAG